MASKQVEVPEGIKRFGWVLGADGENGGIDQRSDGAFFRVSDLPPIYEHFSDRLLFELKYKLEPYTIKQIEDGLSTLEINGS